MTVSEYVTNKHKRLFTTFRVKIGNERVYVENGIEIPEKEFFKRCPLPTLPFASPHNSDTTKKWMTAD